MLRFSNIRIIRKYGRFRKWLFCNAVAASQFWILFQNDAAASHIEAGL